VVQRDELRLLDHRAELFVEQRVERIGMQRGDIEIEAEPYPYLVLEFVAGGSLEDWILTPAVERQPIPDTSELMAGIARGIAAASRCAATRSAALPAGNTAT